MEESPISDGVMEYRLRSWSEFHELTKDTFSRAPAYIYRGQTDYRWLLRSSLDRLEQKHPNRVIMCGKNREWSGGPPFTAEQHLNAFKSAVRGRIAPNTHVPADDDEWWALGQHHGLATPLLDWTRSPYIALFFAFEEECCMTDSACWSKPEHRGVYALSTSAIGADAEQDEDRVRLVSPVGDANYRLITQTALLLKMPRRTDLESYVRKQFEGETHHAILTTMKIPNTDGHRRECLVSLNKMNINHMSLFPDIDGAAKHVNSLWQPGHEDLIAYV